MHKMIRCDRKKITKRYNKALLIANIPSAAAAAVLIAVGCYLFPKIDPPFELYSVYYAVLYAAAAYSFIVTLIISIAAGRRLEGDSRYTYIELLEKQLIVSQFTGAVTAPGERADHRRLWIMDLKDVQSVSVGPKDITITGSARMIEQSADRLDYRDEDGYASFDYWWYNSGGGERTESFQFRDDYFYFERIAQRIIFCAQRCKKEAIRREEFRRHMLEIARKQAEKKNRRNRKKKNEERVFRGMPIKRNF